MEEIFDFSPSNTDPNVDSLRFGFENDAFVEALNADLPLPESIYVDGGIGTSGGIHGGNGQDFGTIGQGSGSCPLALDFFDLGSITMDQICSPGANHQEIGGTIDEPNGFGTTDVMHFSDQICGHGANHQEIGGVIDQPNGFGTTEGSLRSHRALSDLITTGQNSGFGYAPHFPDLYFDTMGQSSGSGASHQKISGIIDGAHEAANTTNVGPALPHDLEQNGRQKQCAIILPAEEVERRRASNRVAAQHYRQKKEQQQKALENKVNLYGGSLKEAFSVMRNLSAAKSVETLIQMARVCGQWVEQRVKSHPLLAILGADEDVENISAA